MRNTKPTKSISEPVHPISSWLILQGIVQHEQVLRCFAERDLPKKQAEILLKCKYPISKLLGRLGFLIEMKPDEVYAAAEKTAQYLLKYPGTIHDRG